MALGASGAGGYGSVPGQRYSMQRISRPAAGNSKLMPAKTPSAVQSFAAAQTKKFIATARQMARGASGVSRISIKV